MNIVFLLFESLCEEKIDENDKRIVLRIFPRLAPIKVSVLPLIKNKHAQEAKRLYNKLSNYMMVQYEETGSIGKRYRRGDAIGIPFAVTVDDDTLEKGMVTVRNCDTMEQERVQIEQLIIYLQEKVMF